MKILSIKLGDKTFQSGKITLYLTREALKLQKDALALGDKAKNMIDDTDEVAAGEMLDGILDLMDRKMWLICEVYGNQFTPEVIENVLSSEDVDLEVNKIIGVASGVIEKN